MKFRVSRSWLIAVAILVALVLWMMSGSLSGPEQTPVQDSDSHPVETIPIVATRESVAELMTSSLILTGRTAAERRVVVKAETSGVIEKLWVERGSQVVEGEQMMGVAIGDREVRLLEARSRLVQAKTSYEAALALKSKGYQAEVQLATMRADLDAARAAVHVAELEIQRTSVTAPIAGIVDERYVESGDFVIRGDPLALIVDLDPIRVVGQVSERYLGQVHAGAQGEARTVDGRMHRGKVSYVGHVAGETTHTFAVELEIANSDGHLIEGITAELSLPVEQVFAHRVPASTLSLADDGTLGVKGVHDGSVQFHAVEVLGDSPDGLWVGGLPERLQLITYGHAFVTSGQRVVTRAQTPGGKGDQPGG